MSQVRMTGIGAIFALFGLVACTGSSEGTVDDLRIIVASRFVPGVNCTTPPPINPTRVPSLVVLSSAQLNQALESSGTTPAYCAIETSLSLEGEAFDLVHTSDGSKLFVSIPTAGKIVQVNPDLSRIPRRDDNTDTRLAIPAEGSRPSCPTRLKLSPDGTKLLVLDDPLDPRSGCNINRGTPRVLLYQLSSSNPPAVLNVPRNFDFVPNIGPMSIGLSNSALLILSPSATNYQLYSFNPNDTNLSERTPAPIATSVPGLNVGLSTANTTLDLSFVGTTLHLAFTQLSAGNILPFNGGFGSPLGFDGRPILATRIVWDERSNLLAAIEPNSNRVIFMNNTRARAESAVGASITFTPDGFAYTAGSSVLTRFDLTGFPNSLNPQSLGAFGFIEAKGIGWLQKPTN